MVFQFFNLLPHLTVRENVELPRRLDGRADAGPRAADLLARVGLADRAGAHPYELSGGEMQRVAIARALVTGARLLLADEPTGNLDSRNGEAVLALLDEIRRERGVTLLLATHSAAAARRADRVVALKDGRVTVLKGFGLVLRALVTGPARRRPARVAAADPRGRDRRRRRRRHPPRQPQRDGVLPRGRRDDRGPERLRRDGDRRASRSSALPSSRFCGEVGGFAPAVTGTAVLAGAARSSSCSASTGAATASCATCASSRPEARDGRCSALAGSVLVPAPLAARHGLAVGSEIALTRPEACRGRFAWEGSSSSRASRARREATFF